MAENTYGTFLMKKDDTGSTYSKLCDIKDYPDMGGAPEMLETTTLSDKMQTYIEGIQSADALEFTTNYDKSTYSEIQKLKGKELDLGLWLGGTEEGGTVTPDGKNGKFKFKGTVSVSMSGKGANEVREMVLTIAPSTSIDFE